MTSMKLGAFSVSLAVKDLAASRAFYEALGFRVPGGDSAATGDAGYLIMKNGEAVIGLFQGMFEGNILTFNPGWDADAQEVQGPWTDVRALQATLKEQGIDLADETDPSGTGPGSIMLADPDGNMILIDQHRSAPG